MKCPGMEMLGWLRLGVLRDWNMPAVTTPPDQVPKMEGVKGWQDGVHYVKSHCDSQVKKAVTAKRRGAAVELRIPSLAAGASKGNPSIHPFNLFSALSL